MSGMNSVGAEFVKYIKSFDADADMDAKDVRISRTWFFFCILSMKNRFMAGQWTKKLVRMFVHTFEKKKYHFLFVRSIVRKKY